MTMSTAKVLALLALATVIVAAVYLGAFATNTSAHCSGGDCVTTHPGIIDDDPTRGWVLLLSPALIPATLLALIHFDGPREIEWFIAVVFLFACIIAIFSIGMFYVPAALLTLAAVAFDRRRGTPQPV